MHMFSQGLISGLLTINYRSCFPYAFFDKYVKYKIVSLNASVLPPSPSNNQDYLRDELKQQNGMSANELYTAGDLPLLLNSSLQNNLN
ncbi:hypothetical protein CLV51_11179 [Chitinophaga niastensis]|uniref:Uncharacterized protein n=1 Tax=Chitinophaga niastensis TaxID=536980 RepID=A0A2P8H8Y6_CHINA|nr:hypothetical protein [Chitinophaga niastensis]PSL42693.1 hypothetical protein CLV51_11179 [Chitinophaga niastensis]